MDTSLSRISYCTQSYSLFYNYLIVFSCVFVWDDSNKVTVCTPSIPVGLKYPPPSKTTSNSMFARLGTDYEIRNQWYFAILETMTTD